MNIGAGGEPSMGPRRPISGGGGPINFLKGVYNDEFQWSVVKSIALFGVGIWIARECAGVDLMTPAPSP